MKAIVDLSYFRQDQNLNLLALNTVFYRVSTSLKRFMVPNFAMQPNSDLSNLGISPLSTGSSVSGFIMLAIAKSLLRFPLNKKIYPFTFIYSAGVTLKRTQYNLNYYESGPSQLHLQFNNLLAKVVPMHNLYNKSIYLEYFYEFYNVF